MHRRTWAHSRLLTVAVLAVTLSIARATPALARPATQIAKLEELAALFEARLASLRGELFSRLSEAETGPQGALNADRDIELVIVLMPGHQGGDCAAIFLGVAGNKGGIHGCEF